MTKNHVSIRSCFAAPLPQSIRVRKAYLPLLNQPLHLPHLALKEAVAADFAAVGIEDDGGTCYLQMKKKNENYLAAKYTFCIFAAK